MVTSHGNFKSDHTQHPIVNITIELRINGRYRTWHIFRTSYSHNWCVLGNLLRGSSSAELMHPLLLAHYIRYNSWRHQGISDMTKNAYFAPGNILRQFAVKNDRKQSHAIKTSCSRTWPASGECVNKGNTCFLSFSDLAQGRMGSWYGRSKTYTLSKQRGCFAFRHTDL